MLDSPENLVELLKQHLSWYPLMEPRDIYKLLYQGVRGPGTSLPPRKPSLNDWEKSGTNWTMRGVIRSGSPSGRMGTCYA